MESDLVMENDKDLKPETADETQAEKDLASRRNFLRGLGKWSLAVIGGVALGTRSRLPRKSKAGSTAAAVRG
jgi:hypothetical protein